MRITKKAAVLCATYIAAALAVMGGFVLLATRTQRDLQRQVARQYSQSFSELCTELGKLDTTLKKATYASSTAMVSAVCAEAYAEALEAQAALGALPYGNMELEHTAAFLSRTGDYVYFISRNAAAGNGFSEEERTNLSVLQQSARTVYDTMSDLYAQVLTGGISVSELEYAERIIGETEDTVTSGFASGFQKLESEFPEFPTLIYDGPFSEHIRQAVPKLIEHEREITGEEAIHAAARFLAVEEKTLNLEYERDSEVPVYVITRQNGSDISTVEVTKAGGKILYFGTTRAAGSPMIDAKDCVKAAEEFLQKHGIPSMTATYWAIESGDVIVNFAYAQDGVVCYPDLIKVSVAMDTGSVSGYESLGYIMSHTPRDVPEVTVSKEDAEASIASSLSVKSHKLTIIPTSGKNEVFCHEFLCEDSDGLHCLIYINAQTGAEEKILMLIEDDNGTLTI